MSRYMFKIIVFVVSPAMSWNQQGFAIQLPLRRSRHVPKLHCSSITLQVGLWIALNLLWMYFSFNLDWPYLVQAAERKKSPKEHIS